MGYLIQRSVEKNNNLMRLFMTPSASFVGLVRLILLEADKGDFGESAQSESRNGNYCQQDNLQSPVLKHCAGTCTDGDMTRSLSEQGQRYGHTYGGRRLIVGQNQTTNPNFNKFSVEYP